jgi:hypothetical protein
VAEIVSVKPQAPNEMVLERRSADPGEVKSITNNRTRHKENPCGVYIKVGDKKGVGNLNLQICIDSIWGIEQGLVMITMVDMNGDKRFDPIDVESLPVSFWINGR